MPDQMPAKRGEPQGKPKPPRGYLDVVRDAIRGIVDLAREAMVGGTALQKIFILVVAVLSIVAVLAGSGFLLYGHSEYAYKLFFVAIVLPMAIFVFLIVFEAFSRKGQPSSVPSWRRVLPKLPIEPAVLDETSQLLEHIRQGALNYLQAMNKDLQDKQVRGNVFLADYSKPRDGVAFELFMPNELRKNMNYPPEWQLRFKPGEGATGCVFIEGDNRVTRRLPTAEGEWDSVFKMSDELKNKVHKDLKWIVSLPLKEPASQSTLAVLNIDGLDHEFNDEQLGGTVKSVSRDIAGLAALIASQPRVNISIRVDGA